MEEVKPKTLISHTIAHAVRGRPTLNDVQRNFRNGPVHESKINDTKVLNSSYEITNEHNEPNITEKYNTIDKISTADITTAMNKFCRHGRPEVKILKRRTTYQEDDSIVNNKKAVILDDLNSRWTQKQLFIFLYRNFNSFVIVSICILICRFILMIFSSYQDIYSTFFVIFVLSFLLVILLYTWTVVYIVQNFSHILDDCYVFDKDFCNVNICNNVVVSIKVQKCRSRYEKYIYYNCTRVVCKCHSNKIGDENKEINPVD